MQIKRKKKRRITGEMLLGAVGLSACLAVLAIGLGQSLSSSRKGPLPSAKEPTSLAQTHAIMETANSRLKFIDIVPGNTWIPEERPLASYAITNKSQASGVYLFDTKDYTIETGGINVPARELCTLLHALMSETSRVPLAEALRGIDLEGSVGGPILKLAARGKLELLIEYLYSIKAIGSIQNRRIQILIKGYADGKSTDWSRPLVANFAYDKIFVLPPVNPNSLNPTQYRGAPQIFQVSNPYRNKDLPDLRAQFVKDDLIEPVLEQCPGASPANVKILKGYEFSRPGNPNLRRVEIQLNVF
jgi:hypothetical protein